MNNQTTATIMTRLRWGAVFLALLFLAVQVIPRAVGQREITQPRVFTDRAGASRGELSGLTGAEEEQAGIDGSAAAASRSKSAIVGPIRRQLLQQGVLLVPNTTSAR